MHSLVNGVNGQGGASTCITGAYQQHILYGMPIKAACPLEHAEKNIKQYLLDLTGA